MENTMKNMKYWREKNSPLEARSPAKVLPLVAMIGKEIGTNVVSSVLSHGAKKDAEKLAASSKFTQGIQNMPVVGT